MGTHPVATMRLVGLVCAVGWLTLLVACQPSNAPPAAASAAKSQEASAKPIQPPTFNGRPLFTGPHRTPKGMKGLGIAGYNYTDTYIDSFAVNGAGGGNIEVSGPTTGGNGVACCASIVDDMPLPIAVEISWRRDGDAPLCKQTVLLDGPVPAEPNYLEVHFYQDGAIQLAITDYPSPARLTLERFNRIQRKPADNVDNDDKFSECKRGG